MSTKMSVIISRRNKSPRENSSSAVSLRFRSTINSFLPLKTLEIIRESCTFGRALIEETLTRCEPRGSEGVVS